MGRAPCCDKTKVKRGPWSPEEDTTLKNYIRKFGTGGNWISLPHKAGLKRCGKSCRLRWLNYLRPDIKHGGFTDEEDNIIITLYNNIGSRWSVIASHLPGRTDNDVKNYWNTKLKKKLLATLNTNLNDNSTPNDSTPFTSTPSSSFLTEVNTYYHGNSDFPNISSSILSTQPLINTNYQQSQAPLEPINHQISLPRLLEVPEIGRGQDGNLIAVSSESNYGWCVDGGGDKDNGPLLGLLGSDFFYDLLNEQFLGRSDLCESSRLDYDTYASSAYMS